MQLWLLRPRWEGLSDEDNPWNPWFDKAFGLVVRAESEEQARRYAHEGAGDENRGSFLGQQTANTTEPWLDSQYSTCVPLRSIEGEPGIIIQDFRSA